MSRSQMGIRSAGQIDPAVTFGYPATTLMEITNFGDGSTRHHLRGPSAPSTNHTAAPVGSDFTEETSPAKYYIKADTANTWTEIT